MPEMDINTAVQSLGEDKNNQKSLNKKSSFYTAVYLFGILVCVLYISKAQVFNVNDAAIKNYQCYQDENNDIKCTGHAEQTAESVYHEETDWRLILINAWNKVPENYKVKLKHLRNAQAVDERIYPDLQRMMDDCRAAGLSPLISSSYRTQEDQERLYNEKVDFYLNQGYSLDKAGDLAAQSVAAPGTSEHQMGLAVDIVDIYNQNLDMSQEQTPVNKWLRENSWKYGFILRYPPDKTDITGVIYEPWHFRYVGKEAAAEIYNKGISLEEYLSRG
jgi:D-alanyl-D-alanine carboxypeptidase